MHGDFACTIALPLLRARALDSIYRIHQPGIVHERTIGQHHRIIIPAYNVSHYIQETVESVLRQTFTDYEIVVVNDGSTDTPVLEAVLQPYLHRIVYLKQPNGGPSAARNTAIRVARGEYIALLDGDDLWDPEYLELMLRALQQRGLDLIWCDTLFFGYGDRANRRFMELTPSKGPCTLTALMDDSVMICTSTVLMRRSAAIEAGLFNENMRYSEDFDLWLRLAAKGFRLGYDRALLCRRRVRQQGLSADSVKLVEGARQAFGNMLHSPDVPRQMQHHIERRIRMLNEDIALLMAKQHLRSGDSRSALHALRAVRDSATWYAYEQPHLDGLQSTVVQMKDDRKAESNRNPSLPKPRGSRPACG